MTDSGELTMLADNVTQEAIAPTPISEWKTITGTGNKDVALLVYVSGYQTVWDDGVGWACVKRYTIGDEGVVDRLAPAVQLCVRAQGPVGENCRVVVG